MIRFFLQVIGVDSLWVADSIADADAGRHFLMMDDFDPNMLAPRESFGESVYEWFYIDHFGVLLAVVGIIAIAGIIGCIEMLRLSRRVGRLENDYVFVDLLIRQEKEREEDREEEGEEIVPGLRLPLKMGKFGLVDKKKKSIVCIIDFPDSYNERILGLVNGTRTDYFEEAQLKGCIILVKDAMMVVEDYIDEDLHNRKDEITAFIYERIAGKKANVEDKKQ